jgi:hypothetical protein
MIITQKYNSAFDIDAEFIPSLEKLLSNCIPSFELIKNYEKSADEDTSFTYYLFFGNTTNAPVGFAQLELKKGKTIKKTFMSKLFKKDLLAVQNESIIKWSIPGSLREGIIFEPMYVKHACEKTKKIFNKLFERKDVSSQNLIYCDAYLEMNKLSDTWKSNSINHCIPETLVKNRSSYEEFVQKLPSEIQSKIKNSWKQIHKELNLKMGDFTNFKESFQYKSKGSSQYKELKKHPKIEKYIKLEENINFLTLESDQEVMAFIIFIKGKGINSFYDTLILNDNVTEIMTHQIAILKFYEMIECNRLHFLDEVSEVTPFTDLGFTQRNQYQLTIQKDK